MENKIKKFIIFIIVFFISSYEFMGCADISEIEYINKQIKINILEPTNISYEDSHGGFHGDGTTFAKLEFSSEDKERVIEEFKENNWFNTQLSDNINIFIYGGMKNGVFYDFNIAKEFKIPKVENGYWYFVDRNSENGDSSSDSEIFNRNSFNITVALYDLDENILYYLEFDT